MKFESKLSPDIAKWVLDTSKMSKEDIEVLTILNVPRSLGYKDCAQMRIARMYANGGYVNKQAISINDITFTTSSKHNAKWYLSRHSLPSNPNETQKKHLEGVMKSKAKQFVYFDAHAMDDLVSELLHRFSSPRPTKHAIVKEEPKKEVKPKGLSNTAKGKIKKAYNEESKSADEIATELDLDKTLVIDYLKKLANA